MVDQPHRPADRLGLGPATGPSQAGLPVTEIAAAVLGIVWIIVSGVYLARQAPDSGLGSFGLVVTLLTVFLPVAVLWVAASTARSARMVRDESRRLQATVDAMRQTYIADRQAKGSGGVPAGEVERKLAEIARATKQAEAVLTTFSSRRGPAPPLAPVAPPVDQPQLALGEVPGQSARPLARTDLIRALNFPDTEGDEAGFAALRRALNDRTARVLIQASQDVLTLLAQDGIYMDDLRPDRARPEIWRRFARGERGRTVAALGGVRDRSSLALTAGRMREDTIFRDAVHHFLRLFDRMLQAFEPEASDEELVDLSETRTARAFMLFGRVTGTFD